MKHAIASALAVFMAIVLAGCSPKPVVSSAAPSVAAPSSAPQASSVSEAPASLPAPVNEGEPLPQGAQDIVLQPGELLFSTRIRHVYTRDFLISFVLSADKQSVRDVLVELTEINAATEFGDGNTVCYRLSSSLHALGDFDAPDGVLSIEKDGFVIHAVVDGEMAAGTVGYTMSVPEQQGQFPAPMEGVQTTYYVYINEEKAGYPGSVTMKFPAKEIDFGTKEAVFNAAARG